MVVLREFLYRRDDLVSQFLEQLEGGIYDAEEITQRSQSAKGLGGAVGVGAAKVSADRKQQSDREAAMTLRQTDASRFDRLCRLLEEGEALQTLESLDDGIWDQLVRNEILELHAALALAPGVAEINNARALSAAGPLLDLMRSLPNSMLPQDFDRAEADRMSEQLPVVQEFADHFAEAPIPCTFSPLGAPRYTFFAQLNREHLLVEVDELEGEVIVLAKIQRLIPKGKPETVGSGVIPNVALNRQQRRKQKTEQPLTLRLSHPAALVTAIAINR